MNIPGHNHGLKGFTSKGGECTLKNFGSTISGGAKNLSQTEMDAYQKAKLYAMEQNGSKWDKAKEVLEQAGFEVLSV